MVMITSETAPSRIMVGLSTNKKGTMYLAEPRYLDKKLVRMDAHSSDSKRLIRLKAATRSGAWRPCGRSVATLVFCLQPLAPPPAA